TASTTGHFEGEAIRRRKNGTTFWANIVIDPLFDKTGHITGFSKVVRDITQIKKINEELESRVSERTTELREREAQLRTITNAIPVLVAQVDNREHFLFANNFFCEWFHRTPEQISGLT